MKSPQPEDPLLPVEELEISAHEREQILSQIESVIAKSRGPETADLLILPAQKKGLLFPLLINLAAVLLIAAGAAFGDGRDAALRDVMSFLGYLSGSVENRQAFEARLLAQARRDPLYRAVTREIQILMAGGSASGGLTAPFMFLGIVSSVSAGKVVVEAMVDLKPSVGAVIQIRRISDLEKELSIAEGKVLQVQGSKITARDMVYIEVSSSGG